MTDPDDDVRWIRRVLVEGGITVPKWSEFHRILADIEEFAAGVRGTGPAVDPQDRPKLMRILAGSPLLKHLRRLEEDKPQVFRAGRQGWFAGKMLLGRPGDERSPARDRMWELFTLAACARTTDDPELAPEGENPDVRCHVRNVRWGIECKVFYSSNPRRQVEELGTKVDQLQASDVTRGVVAVNISALIDHGTFFGPAIAPMSRRAAEEQLRINVERIVRPIDSPQLQREIRDSATGRPHSKLAGVFFLAETLAIVGDRYAMVRRGHSLLFDQSRIDDVAFHNRLHLGMESPPHPAGRGVGG